MTTYRVHALDHHGNPLITIEHTTPQPVHCLAIQTSWIIGTIAITDTTGHPLAIIACPTGHPSRKPPTIHVDLETQ